MAGEEFAREAANGDSLYVTPGVFARGRRSPRWYRGARLPTWRQIHAESGELLQDRHLQWPRDHDASAAFRNGPGTLHALEQASVWRSRVSAILELLEELPELFERVHVAVADGAPAKPGPQLRPSHEASQGRVRGVIGAEVLVHPADECASLRGNQPHPSVAWGGAQLDQQSVGLQDSSRLLQGMDHALDCDSSE